MVRDNKQVIAALLKEFEVIKDSLKPVLNEVKKSKETCIEFKKFKDETNAKLRKLDFEFRRNSSKKLPMDNKKMEKQISDILSQIDHLKNAIGSIKASKCGCTDYSKQIQRLNDEINEVKKIQAGFEFPKELAGEVEKLKKAVLKKMDTVDKKQTESLRTTKQKVGVTIAELNALQKTLSKAESAREIHDSQIEKEIKEQQEAIKELKKTISVNAKEFETIKKDVINNKYKVTDIKTADKKIDELSKKIEDVQVALNRSEKRRITEISDVKNRFMNFERRASNKGEVDKLQTDIQKRLGEKTLKLENELLGIKKEFKSEVSKEVEKREADLKSEINRFLNALDQRFEKEREHSKGLLTGSLIKIERVMKEDQASVHNFRKDIEKFTSNIKEIKRLKDEIEGVKLNIIESNKEIQNKIKSIPNHGEDIQRLNEDLGKYQKINIKIIEELKHIGSTMQNLSSDSDKMSKNFESNMANLRSEMDKLNIKVQKTSEILGEMDKVL